MKKIFILFFFPILIFAQTINRNLIVAKSFEFRKNIFVYGFNQSGNDLTFILYKFSHELGKIDSSTTAIGKENYSTYLEINSDTVHGYLNFYLQKANNKSKVTLIRFNDSLKTITRAENFEVNKINSLTTFENEYYSFKNTTYTIRTTEDSLGKQFFLNKYELISELKPFEYNLSWQYPLEKRNISSTHVIFADNEAVFVYVTIISGEKKGQWIIKLNAKTGVLIKGIKLNSKGDTRSFVFSACYYDQKTKDLLITGNIYNEQQICFETKKYDFLNLDKQNTYFFTTIDSTCENTLRNEKTVPIEFAVKPTASKEKIFYHVKCKELIKIGPSEYSMYCSLYKNNKTDLLFFYETGFYIKLFINESDVEFYTDKIHNCTGLLQGIVNNTINDINGKIEFNSVYELDKLLYKWPIADIERIYGQDDLKKPKWVLVKNEKNSDKKTFYIVRIGLKGVEQKILFESSKYNHPELYKINDDKLIIFNTNSENNSFSITVKTW